MNALIVVCGLGVAALLSEIVNFRKWLTIIILAGLVAAMALLGWEWNSSAHYFSNMMVMDNFSIAFTLLLLVLAAFWFWLSTDYLNHQTHQTDRAALVLFVVLGGALMISFDNMAMLFLGLEILSLSLYVLAGSRKENLFSTEASFKYFLMGSFATGFLLFGIALIYGATGSFNVTTIAERLTAMGEYPVFLLAGVILVFVGIGFKISAVPFHFWVPDVYDGAPTAITTLMATVVKVAAVGAFYRLFAYALAPLQAHWLPVIKFATVATLLVSNITAVYQTNVKRMLAYSSVAHIGYLLLAFVSTIASASVFFYYLASYAVASLATFFIVMLLEEKGGTSVDAFKGLFRRSPFLAFSITVALLSLAGIPPLAGFFAKYMVFAQALENGQVGLVVLAIITSLMGVFYYFKVIIAIFSTDASAPPFKISETRRLIIGILICMIVVLGIFPDLIRII